VIAACVVPRDKDAAEKKGGGKAPGGDAIARRARVHAERVKQGCWVRFNSKQTRLRRGLAGQSQRRSIERAVRMAALAYLRWTGAAAWLRRPPLRNWG